MSVWSPNYIVVNKTHSRRTRVMLTSGLADKNMSSLQHSVINVLLNGCTFHMIRTTQGINTASSCLFHGGNYAIEMPHFVNICYILTSHN